MNFFFFLCACSFLGIYDEYAFPPYRIDSHPSITSAVLVMSYCSDHLYHSWGARVAVQTDTHEIRRK